MFRGASALEPQESEMTEPAEFDAVTDEIRRWSSLSADECQRFVCVEDGVLNEFEMMWHLRNVFPLLFFFSSRLRLTWPLRPMWSKCSHGRDNFQKLILTLTDSLSWYR